MKKIVTGIFIFTLLIMYSCSSVPLTGRRQMLLVSDQDILTASLTQYNDYMKSAVKSTSTNQSAQVLRVGRNIASATEAYLKANGMGEDVSNFGWECALVQDPQVNAFCMPGGKIVVYEGLMSLIGSDDELAVVIGHEVAHAVARHSNERMSQQLMTQYGAHLVGLSLNNKSAMMKNLANSVYGLGTQFGMMLPYSRKHELEADYMGLVFMTMAGYEPAVAVTFWQKMASGKSTASPEFMSTHPADATRIEALRQHLPEMTQYKK